MRNRVTEIVLVAIIFMCTGFLSTACHLHKAVEEAPSSVPMVTVPDPDPTSVSDSEETDHKVTNTPVIVLSAKNTYAFRGEVTELSVAKAANDIMTLSQHLAPSETIYLVLDTPGGDIQAGNKLIDALKALPQKIKTITIFSASMGFQIVQNMDERLITPTGTLMSHRAAVNGMRGSIPGPLLVELSHIMRIVDRLDVIASQRMGMDVRNYKELIRDEYWVSGEDAVHDKAADKVVLIRCDKSLMETEDLEVPTIFGIAKIKFSKCPAISGPVSIDISQMKFSSKEEKEKYLKYQNELLYNKEAFVRDYIVGK